MIHGGPFNTDLILELEVVDSDEEDQADFDTNNLAASQPMGPPNTVRDAYRPEIQTVNVYSVGWYTQGCRWKRSIHDLVEDLNKRLAVRFRSWHHIHIYMDCRAFYQPPPGTGHIGSNEKDVADFVWSKHFTPWLRVLKRQLDPFEDGSAAVGGDGRTVSILLCCKAGRNRSVAGKTVVNYVLEKAGYMTNSNTGHLSKSSWSNSRHATCSTCTGCTVLTPDKKKSLEFAFRKWNTV